jgi:hypothetical protein
MPSSAKQQPAIPWLAPQEKHTTHTGYSPPKGRFVLVTCGIIGRLEAKCMKGLPEKRLRKT